MKNLTLSVDEKVLSAVRRYAAERDTSVNRLVRDYFDQIATQEDRVAEARRRLIARSDRSTARIGNAKWTRDELHER